MSDRDLADAVEIIHDRLYWVPLHHVPHNTPRTHFFCIDHELTYEPFFADFGPLNLSMVYHYCKMLENKLTDPALADKRIVHYCSNDHKKRANAATLMGIYQVAVMGKPAELAYEPFCTVYPPFLPYRDASCGVCNFHLTILDCLKGMEQAIRHRWFDVNRFDVESYDFFQKVENGDMNWIVPDKFLAFAGPCPTSTDADGFPAFTPEEYLAIFREAGISLVVRLNKKQYDRRRFIDHGIRHVDLYFLDGSCPSRDIISKFLHITESEQGAVAVHCKAGLGRTGTLIGLYAMKHFQFPARAFIGWNRICRPGSILGPQQQFLVDMQDDMWQAGAFLRRGPLGLDAERQLVQQVDRMSLRQAEQYEDAGQGERLCNAKRNVRGGGGGGGGSWAPSNAAAAGAAESSLPPVSRYTMAHRDSTGGNAVISNGATSHSTGGHPDQARAMAGAAREQPRSDRPGVSMFPRSLRGVFSGR